MAIIDRSRPGSLKMMAINKLDRKSINNRASQHLGKQRNFVGEHFWARGYFVSTVGRDEKVIRQYIRNQEAEDKRLDQLRML